MVKYLNGTVVRIHRNDAGYMVEAVAANGNVIDWMECESFAEARAVLATPVERW